MASSSPINQDLILFSENIIQTHQHSHNPDRQCRDPALILLEDCTQNRDEHVDKHADYDTADIIIHEDGYQPHAGNRKKFYRCKIKALCSLKKRMPTITSAAPVAAPGIIRNRGLMKQHSRKKKPVVIAVRPVRPPASIPEADSAKVLIVEIPKKEPTRRNSFHIKSSPPAKCVSNQWHILCVFTDSFL